MAVSRKWIPLVRIAEIVYSLGRVAFCHSRRFGSTEVGSWAVTVDTDEMIITSKAQNRNKSRCMFDCSGQSRVPMDRQAGKLTGISLRILLNKSVHRRT